MIEGLMGLMLWCIFGLSLGGILVIARGESRK